MKAVVSEIIITNVSTRVDGSLSLRLNTPELRPDEKLVFLELTGCNIKALFQPLDGQADGLKEVKADLDEKTPAQRLRAVLFLLWKHKNEAIEFEVFYRQKMNGFIEHLKARLPQENEHRISQPKGNGDKPGSESPAKTVPEPALKDESLVAAQAPPSDKLTPQQELAGVVINGGHNWSTFARWAEETGNIPDATSVPGFDDMRTKDAQRLLRSKAGLLKGLDAVKGVKQ